jgi:hypothetical protein
MHHEGLRNLLADIGAEIQKRQAIEKAEMAKRAEEAARRAEENAKLEAAARRKAEEEEQARLQAEEEARARELSEKAQSVCMTYCISSLSSCRRID